MKPYIKTPKKITLPLLFNVAVKAYIKRSSGSYNEAPEDNSEYEVLQVAMNGEVLKTNIFDDLVLQEVEQNINESSVSFHDVEIDLPVIVTSEGVFYTDFFEDKFDIAPFLNEEELEWTEYTISRECLLTAEELIEKDKINAIEQIQATIETYQKSLSFYHEVVERSGKETVKRINDIISSFARTVEGILEYNNFKKNKKYAD